MRIKSSLIAACAIFGLSKLTDAQCPEICDNDAKNTALGFQALQHSNVACHNNTAVGYQAMANNTDGDYNTAFGLQALLNLTVGSLNTAVGAYALASDNGGWDNTAVGYQALSRSTAAVANTALGENALGQDTTGGNNIAIGNSAGYNLTTGNNNIDIGNGGVAGESNTIRIGKKGTQTSVYVAGISGATVAGGVGVIVDSSGHLGTVVSSARFKDKIEPMDKSSEAILSLKPVTFRYKKDLDPKAIPQFGLVAEQVEKVNPDLVARDEQGKPYTVRYEAVNAMLLNEFLKEHRRVEELATNGQKQDATITQLESALTQQRNDFRSVLAQQKQEIQALTEALKAQAVQIQKVSEQVEASKPAPRLVADSQ